VDRDAFPDGCVPIVQAWTVSSTESRYGARECDGGVAADGWRGKQLNTRMAELLGGFTLAFFGNGANGIN
jgi:hypothetical protein